MSKRTTATAISRRSTRAGQMAPTQMGLTNRNEGKTRKRRDKGGVRGKRKPHPELLTRRRKLGELLNLVSRLLLRRRNWGSRKSCKLPRHSHRMLLLPSQRTSSTSELASRSSAPTTNQSRETMSTISILAQMSFSQKDQSRMKENSISILLVAVPLHRKRSPCLHRAMILWISSEEWTWMLSQRPQRKMLWTSLMRQPTLVCLTRLPMQTNLIRAHSTSVEMPSKIMIHFQLRLNQVLSLKLRLQKSQNSSQTLRSWAECSSQVSRSTGPWLRGFRTKCNTQTSTDNQCKINNKCMAQPCPNTAGSPSNNTDNTLSRRNNNSTKQDTITKGTSNSHNNSCKGSHLSMLLGKTHHSNNKIHNRQHRNQHLSTCSDWL